MTRLAGLRLLLGLSALLASLVACGERDSEAPSEPPAEQIFQARGSDFSDPDLAAAPGGDLALVWLAFDGGRDRVMASLHHAGRWSEPIAVSSAAGEYLTPRVEADPAGGFLVVWTVAGGGRADIEAARLIEARVEPLGLVADDPGQDLAACLVASREGALWVAWQSRRQDRHFDVFARPWSNGRFGPEVRVTDHPASDIQPALGVAPDGAVWAAWSSWRDGRYADGNYEVHARRLDPPSEPARVSTSSRADMLPAFAELADGLALVWTESGFPTTSVGDISAVAYDAWMDKTYQISWLEGERFPPPEEVRVSSDPATGSAASVQPFPIRGVGGEDVWLLYGDRVVLGGFDRPWKLALARVGRGFASHPTLLAAGSVSPMARYTAAWSGEHLWVVDEIEPRPAAPAPPARAALRVRRIAPSDLPAPVAASPPARPAREPVDPALKLDVPAGGSTSVQLGSRTWQAYFGNLHLHSDLSGDRRGFEGRPEDNLQVLEDIAQLDFGSLSDHVETLREVDWWTTRKLSDLWDRPGRFVSLPGYEWTSLEYGHRNVFFPDTAAGDQGARFQARAGETPDSLWEQLGQRRALAIPHHPSQALAKPLDWSFRNDRFQRLVEIFQRRGSYEYDGAPIRQVRSGFVPGHSVRDALALGHRLGIIASPDHGGGLGLAGVWASELTREGIFEALYARRTFGTTGAKMRLFFSVAGAPQGSEIAYDEGPISIRASVEATAPGLELTIVRDGVEIERFEFPGSHAELAWEDRQKPSGARYYYLRARQFDGHLGWSSPVWIGPPAEPGGSPSS